MLDLAAIGTKIAHLRMDKGYSQETLAGSLYVSRQAISSWEQGKSAPTIDNILELSKIFGVSFEEILCLHDETHYDENDLFKGHDRNYVLRSFIEGRIAVPFAKIFYQANGDERMVLLKAAKEKRCQIKPQELTPLLNEEERTYLLGERKSL